MEVEGREPWSLSYLGRGRGPDAGEYTSSYFYSAKSDILCGVFVLCVAASGHSAISNTHLANPAPRPSYSHNKSHPPRLTRLT